MDDTEARLPFLQQRYQGSKASLAEREGCCTIERIEHPLLFVTCAFGAALFAEDVVFWVALVNPSTHRGLSPAVGLGDGGTIQFYLDGRRWKARKDFTFRSGGEFKGE